MYVQPVPSAAPPVSFPSAPLSVAFASGGHMTPRTLTALLAASLTLGACASGGEHRSSRSDRQLLTREQIADTRATNAYEAIQQLRSNWLRTQGAVSVRQVGEAGPLADNPENIGAVVRVFLNNQQLGGVETLRGIEAGMVQYVRYYREAEAASRWGRQVGSGPVIYISTRAES